MEVRNYNHQICKKIFKNNIKIFFYYSKKIIMETPEYKFLIPAVKDFPDELIKKPRNNIKKDKEEPKHSEEEEEYADSEEDEDYEQNI